MMFKNIRKAYTGFIGTSKHGYAMLVASFM